MNLRELKEKLVAAGIPDDYYFLVGIDRRGGGKGGSNGELAVEQVGGEWAVYSYERGSRNREVRYPTEEAACAAAWEELRSTPRAPARPRSPEQRAADRRQAQELAAREKERLRRLGPAAP